MAQPIVIAIAGEDKSTKTSVGLTFPKPLAVLETDINTVSRAIHRFQGQDIKVYQFPTPVGWDKVTERDIKSVWINFLTEYKKQLENVAIQAIQIDTSTKLWWICCNAYLQELNEKAKIQGKPPRERLQEIEYGEPNNRMASVIYAARAYKKNLILIHHMRGVYQMVMTDNGMKSVEIPGKREMDGFKYTESLVDLEIRVAVKDLPTKDSNGQTIFIKKPIGEISLSGLALEMVGQELVEPTYEKLCKIIGMWRSDW